MNYYEDFGSWYFAVADSRHLRQPPEGQWSNYGYTGGRAKPAPVMVRRAGGASCAAPGEDGDGVLSGGDRIGRSAELGGAEGDRTDAVPSWAVRGHRVCFRRDVDDHSSTSSRIVAHTTRRSSSSVALDLYQILSIETSSSTKHLPPTNPHVEEVPSASSRGCPPEGSYCTLQNLASGLVCCAALTEICSAESLVDCGDCLRARGVPETFLSWAVSAFRSSAVHTAPPNPQNQNHDRSKEEDGDKKDQQDHHGDEDNYQEEEHEEDQDSSLSDFERALLADAQQRLDKLRGRFQWPRSVERPRPPEGVPEIVLERPDVEDSPALKMFLKAFALLGTKSGEFWQRGFTVKFTQDRGVDWGALTKAFANLLAADVFRADSGLFRALRSFEDTASTSFVLSDFESSILGHNPAAARIVYSFVGRFVGYCFYMRARPLLPLSKWLYKCLLSDDKKAFLRRMEADGRTPLTPVMGGLSRREEIEDHSSRRRAMDEQSISAGTRTVPLCQRSATAPLHFSLPRGGRTSGLRRARSLGGDHDQDGIGGPEYQLRLLGLPESCFLGPAWGSGSGRGSGSTEEAAAEAVADLATVDADRAKGLRELLAFSGEVEDVFCLDFSLDLECCGVRR